MAKPSSVLSTTPGTSHARLLQWVEHATVLPQLDDVYVCDGSAEEYDTLAQMPVGARAAWAAVGRELSTERRQTNLHMSTKYATHDRLR